MKLVKMSLAAAVLLGASAFAIDNIKVSGDAKLFYATDSAGYYDINGNYPSLTTAVPQQQSGLFDKGSSAADAALRLSVTGDLLKGVSFGVTGYAISTLGLENNLVDKVWTGAHDVSVGNGAPYGNVLGGAEAGDQAWIGEMWVAATLGKTTAKLGRMELDTPLAFSEKWSIVPNTFDAAVVINQDIPDTTLVAAYIGKGNGTNIAQGSNLGFANQSGADSLGLAYDGGVVGAGANFHNFMNDGAYAVAAINNSFKPLTAQAWYYNVGNIADAYWLQADWACQLVKGVKVGVQYADMSPKGSVGAYLDNSDVAGQTINNDTTGYAVKLAYEGITNLNLSAAYSDVDDQGFLQLANIATGNLNGSGQGQSKLYTEANWNYGFVGAPGAQSYSLTAAYDIKDVVKLTSQYTDVTVKDAAAKLANDQSAKLKELALTASKSFGPLDATVAYIYTDSNVLNQDPNGITGFDGRSFDTLQVYLTLNF